MIEVSTGEMGNKPDAVKLGWLKMRTKEDWTKQRYVKALDRTIKKLRDAVAAETAKEGIGRACRRRLPLDSGDAALADFEHLVLARNEPEVHVGDRLSVNLAPRPAPPAGAPRWSRTQIATASSARRPKSPARPCRPALRSGTCRRWNLVSKYSRARPAACGVVIFGHDPSRPAASWLPSDGSRRT